MPRSRPGGRDFKAFLMADPGWGDLEIRRERTPARTFDLAEPPADPVDGEQALEGTSPDR